MIGLGALTSFTGGGALTPSSSATSASGDIDTGAVSSGTLNFGGPTLNRGIGPTSLAIIVAVAFGALWIIKRK